MKEQLTNEMCLMFARVLPDVNTNTIRSVITVALEHYTVTKSTTEITTYNGDPNEKLLKAFLVAKKVNGASDKTVNRGMPIEQVSKMLGHESVETTQIYLDLNEETLKNACKKYVC